MSVYISVKLQKQIRQHFQNCCAYCQTAEFLTATTFEFEHIKPLAAGGETSFSNLCLACPSCNRYKGDRQSVTVIRSGLTIALFHPHLQEWKEHFRWNDDGSEIIPITPVGEGTIDALRMNRPALVRARKMWVKLNEHPPPS
ncbi:MAG: HNH endonuclease signature motif containing protein [Synechocystis sp.]|nr:HNH endonuclease signature motif containing protein [Synechocystis sp.]